MFYVYILSNSKDSELYVGSTNNLKRRFEEHNKGNVLSTKNVTPLTLLYYEAYNQEHLARKREQSLKHNQRTKNLLIKRIK